jgi:hypothetical protein
VGDPFLDDIGLVELGVAWWMTLDQILLNRKGRSRYNLDCWFIDERWRKLAGRGQRCGEPGGGAIAPLTSDGYTVAPVGFP